MSVFGGIIAAMGIIGGAAVGVYGLSRCAGKHRPLNDEDKSYLEQEATRRKLSKRQAPYVLFDWDRGKDYVPHVLAVVKDFGVIPANAPTSYGVWDRNLERVIASVNQSSP